MNLALKFNMCISKGTIHKCFNSAKVTPIFNKASETDKSYYRPISIVYVILY